MLASMQAVHAAAAAAAAAASAGDDIQPEDEAVPEAAEQRSHSAWCERQESVAASWEQHASEAALALLRQQAAPHKCCDQCALPIQDVDGAAVRCWTCEAPCSRVLCRACDKVAHKHTHMHERQRFTRGTWEPLPRSPRMSTVRTRPA